MRSVGFGLLSVVVVAMTALIGVQGASASAFGEASGLQQTCIKVATGRPQVEEATMQVKARYTGVYSYEDLELVKGEAEPLPEECVHKFGRELSYTLEVQSATNPKVWMPRGKLLLSEEPDPIKVKDPFEGPGFVAESTTMGISMLYVHAHESRCRAHQRVCYDELTPQHLNHLRNRAWLAVKRYGLYVCSATRSRPPLLRSRRETPGPTQARIVLHARATRLPGHQVIAGKNFTRPLTVMGAC